MVTARHYHTPTFGTPQGLGDAECLICGVTFTVSEFLNQDCPGPRQEETACVSLPSASSCGSSSLSSSASWSPGSARSAATGTIPGVETVPEARDLLLAALCREHNDLGEAIHHANRRRAKLARAITRLRMGYHPAVIRAELDHERP